MLIEIEGYNIHELLSGPKMKEKDLRQKFLRAVKMIDMCDFTDLFCRLYKFDRIPYSDNIDVDYVMDLDTWLVYKPKMR